MNSGGTQPTFDKALHSWFEEDTKPNDVVRFYDTFVQEYNDFAGNFAGMGMLRDHLKPYVDGKTGLKVLDVGAGSGWLTVELLKILDKPECVDALEPSTKMLEVAEKKNLFNKTYVEFMEGYQSTTVPDGKYDLVSSCGAFVPCHIPLSALYEFNRVTKIGGIIAIIMREQYIYEYAGYRDWDKTLDGLEEAGVWKRLERRVHMEGYFYHHQGAMFIYQKLKDFKP